MSYLTPDEAAKLVKGTNRFTRLYVFFVLSFAQNFFMGLVYSIAFLFYEPTYSCYSNREHKNIICERELACSMEKVEYVDYFRNFITDFGLDCNDRHLILLFVSGYFLTTWLGIGVFNTIGDLVGRKTVVVGSMTI